MNTEFLSFNSKDGAIDRWGAKYYADGIFMRFNSKDGAIDSGLNKFVLSFS